MLKYKLVKKVNPLKRQDPPKWYATPVTGEPQTTKAMTRAATENTTTAPIEMEAAIDLFGRYAIQQLQAGNSVRLGELGTLRFTFKSAGVDTLDDYNPTQNIKEVRVIFTPSKTFREQVLLGVQFTEAGVLDEDISYASLDDYHRAQGTNPGGGEEEGGSSSGGNGEGTLG
jgi:predicted histone-like DNA-binding protein